MWASSIENKRLCLHYSQVQLLDGGLAARSASFDVLQENSTVFLVDEGAGVLQQVDPATVATTTSVSMPGPRSIELGGGTVAVLDSRSGQVYTTPATRVGELSDEELEPVTRLGADAVLAVGADGVTHGVSPTDATLVSIPRDFDPEDGELEVAELGVSPQQLDDAEIQVSAVGEQPVALVRDARSEERRVGRGGRARRRPSPHARA